MRFNTATYGFFAEKIAVFSHFTGFLAENGGHFRNFLQKYGKARNYTEIRQTFLFALYFGNYQLSMRGAINFVQVAFHRMASAEAIFHESGTSN